MRGCRKLHRPRLRRRPLDFPGFVYYGGTFTTVDAPAATPTGVTAINDHGDIAGQADLDAFAATAAHGDGVTSMDDFLPGASGVGSGSSQSANAAGISDQDPSTRCPSARCHSPESPEAALSLMTDGHA